jgi:pantoate--beta-alanine ligase
MKQIEIAKTIDAVRTLVKQAKAAGKRIGFVPTMGALHAGHVSLIEAAKAQTEVVVVSVFVNPTQFAPNEDFNKYPRTLDADIEICRNTGVDVVFAPSVRQMYATEQLTWVDVEKLADVLCGVSRPGHFRGVTTVCAKLFNIVSPDIAFFGQKDAQQAIIIRRMVVELNMPLEIVVCPTVRESNGLAMSSRNKYLSEQQRQEAAAIYESLRKAEQLIRSGEKNARNIIAAMHQILQRTGSIQTEYIHIVDEASLADIQVVRGTVLIAVAARIGPTRLIDNILIDVSV